MTYKLITPAVTGDPVRGVFRKEDKTSIPFDSANIDYQEYLEWVAAGNTADPAD